MGVQTFSPQSFTSFGDLLKYLRRREKLTQLELSIAVGYSEGQISRLEKNQRLPDLTALKALFVPALHLENEPELIKHFLELAESARQEEVPAPGIAPYKGLLFFDEYDADLFFGREALTAHLADHVMDLAMDSSWRFLAVIGASGSGKSSLVRAGLAVALKRAGWDACIFTPSAQPLKMLVTNLKPPRTKDSERVFIIVDQFEEVFTLCHDESERIAFIEKLLAFSNSPLTLSPKTRNENATVIIVLRADFYSHLAQYPLLREAVAAAQEYIGQMTAKELRRAIEEPAKRGGWEFEHGLVDILLQDIGLQGSHELEPGALPLLSHVLLTTWQHRRGHVVTVDGYHASGGVRGAIAETAESVFTDQLNQQQQELAHDVFLRLTELGEGTEDTRRRATLNELVRQSGEATQLRAVLNTLAEARLITLNEDSAEVAHEALIREWQRLREWLHEDREGLKLHRHLTEATQEWEMLQRDADALYRGARLAQINEWAALHPHALNPRESMFLDASNARAVQEEQQREEQRQRELAAAKNRAEIERQSAARLRVRNKVIMIIGVCALLLAGLAGLFSIRSQANFTRAEAQRLAAEANNLYKSSGSPELIALLALHSMNLQYSAQGDEVLTRAANLNYPKQIYTGHTKAVWGAAFSVDDKYVLTGSEDGTARMWDRKTGQEVRQFGCPYLVYQVAFAPDGRSVLTNCGDTSIRLWDPETGKELHQFAPTDFADQPFFSRDGKRLLAASRDAIVWEWDTETGQLVKRIKVPLSARSRLFVSPDGKYVLTQAFSDHVVRLWSIGQTVTEIRSLSYDDTLFSFSVAFSSDNAHILIGYSGGAILVWDVTSGEIVQSLKGHTAAVTGITLSPDGKYVLTGSADKTVRLWDWHTGAEVLRLSQPDPVFASTLSADGRYVLAGANDGTVRLWDTLSQSRLPLFTGHAATVSAISFSPDGKLLATGGSDGMRLWDVGSGRLIRGFPEAGSINYGVKFSPDGRYLLSGNWAGVVTLWNVNTGQQVQNFVLDTSTSSGINDVAFSPDQRRVLAGGFDDSVFSAARVWDIETGKPIFTSFVGHQMADVISRVSFSPDNQYMLTAHGSGLVRLWDPEDGTLLGELPGHTDVVNGAAFSPDGKYMATAGNDKIVRLWNVKTRQEIRQFIGHTEAVWSVVFSPDGTVIATASADGTAKLWNTDTGAELRRFVGHTAGVENIAFTPDGKFIGTVSDDGTARLWDFDYHTTIQYLCSQLLRDFTEVERTQYNITDTTHTCPVP
jgi:WD40 repeat protein/transcriptional regulator with XRE-family HTH domain